MHRGTVHGTKTEDLQPSLKTSRHEGHAEGRAGAGEAFLQQPGGLTRARTSSPEPDSTDKGSRLSSGAGLELDSHATSKGDTGQAGGGGRGQRGE